MCTSVLFEYSGSASGWPLQDSCMFENCRVYAASRPQVSELAGSILVWKTGPFQTRFIGSGMHRGNGAHCPARREG